MNFREAIVAIPFQTSGTNTGLLAPIIRAAGHILYVTAALAAEEQDPDACRLTNEEVHRELEAASGHLVRVVATAQNAPISTAAKNRVIVFCDAVALARDEYDDWDANDRGNNLKDLADRTAALGAFFDAELAGIAHSDPGRTL